MKKLPELSTDRQVYIEQLRDFTSAQLRALFEYHVKKASANFGSFQIANAISDEMNRQRMNPRPFVVGAEYCHTYPEAKLDDGRIIGPTTVRFVVLSIDKLQHVHVLYSNGARNKFAIGSPFANSCQLNPPEHKVVRTFKRIKDRGLDFKGDPRWDAGFTFDGLIYPEYDQIEELSSPIPFIHIAAHCVEVKECPIPSTF